MKCISYGCLLAGLLLAATPARAQGLGFMEQASPADETYTKATKALDERQWAAAIQAFDAVLKQNGPRSDAALYWKAYAQNKQGLREEALESIRALRQNHAKSRWVNDARALEVEVRQAMGHPVSPDATSDEEMKLMALNSLMNSDPERALPILQKILAGSPSRRLQERALFVLSQSDSPKSRQVLGDLARGNSNPELQRQAVRVLGYAGNRENRQVLVDIYNSGAQSEVKREILRAFMVAGEKDRLAALAKSEKDAGLRREAIRQLGVMGNQSALSDLYATESDVEVRKEILQSMMVGGAADRLIAAAQSEKDPELRRKAIQLLGVMGRDKTGQALIGLYNKETDLSIRKQVLNALFIQGDSKALVEIARKEQDLTLKREAVQKLSLMKSSESTEYMLELLNK